MTCTWYLALIPARNTSKCSIFWIILNMTLGINVKYHYLLLLLLMLLPILKLGHIYFQNLIRIEKTYFTQYKIDFQIIFLPHSMFLLNLREKHFHYGHCVMPVTKRGFFLFSLQVKARYFCKLE